MRRCDERKTWGIIYAKFLGREGEIGRGGGFVASWIDNLIVENRFIKDQPEPFKFDW